MKACFNWQENDKDTKKIQTRRSVRVKDRKRKILPPSLSSSFQYKPKVGIPHGEIEEMQDFEGTVAC